MKPDISIVMMTYYHEEYIAFAIESVLKQKTNCSYELIIADDYSTDGTRKIIESYRSKYPDIIKTIYNSENIGITNNMFNAISVCSGKYITFLSGDDFWTNENRLETQYSFLEKNLDYYSVTGITEARLNGDKIISLSPKKNIVNKELSLNDYLRGCAFDTHAVMVRNIYLEKGGAEYLHKIVEYSPYIDDSTMCILFLLKGASFTLADHFGVYRVIKGNKTAHNYNSLNSTFRKAKLEVDLYNNLALDFTNIDLSYLYGRALALAILASIKSKDTNDWRVLYKSLPAKFQCRKTKLAICDNILKISARTIKLRING